MKSIPLLRTLIIADGREKCINNAMDYDVRKGFEYEVELFAEMMRVKMAQKKIAARVKTA